MLWRTYVDDMPKEAAMITVLALADMYAAAQIARTPWTLLLDEFGGVMHIAANRALAMLQRGRSHHGQVIVVTQSAADPEALTGQPGLLASLTDNFTGFAIHRQNAPETRDWLAKLMGTTAIWQSDRPDHRAWRITLGEGSRRRVRQFRVGADTFAELAAARRSSTARSAATPNGPSAARPAPTRRARRIGTGKRRACEIECIRPDARSACTRRSRAQRKTHAAPPSVEDEGRTNAAALRGRGVSDARGEPT